MILQSCNNSIPRWGAVCAAILLATQSYESAFAQQTGDEDVLISFESSGLEITDAMSILAQITGFNILVSPDVSGTLTAFIVDMPATEALRQIVEVNGLHHVKKGNVVWVLSDEEFFQGLDLGLERRVISLKHAKADQIALALQDVQNQTLQIVPYPDSNVIVLTENKDRIEKVEATIAKLDQPASTRVFQLQHASAADVIQLLQPHLPTPTSAMPDIRTNQIAITAPIDTLDRVEELLSKLDIKDKVSTRTYVLKYADAVETAELIREVLTGRRQSQQGQGGLGSSLGGQQQPPPTVFTTEPGRASARPLATWQAQRGATTASPPSSTPGEIAGPGGEATPAAAPTSAGTGPEGEALALGPLASVAADSRTNSVIVTHIESALERIQQIIDSIDVPGTFHTYTFQNVNPADLQLETRLAPLLPSTEPFISVDPISKKVSFRAPFEQAQEILNLLREWDQLIRQVRIEAEILSVDANFFRELGVSWQAVVSELTDLGVVNSVDAQVNFPANLANTASQTRLSFGVVSDDDYNAVIQAVRQDNDTQVLATPRILVRDGQEANFTSVRDQPFTTITVDGNTQTTLEDVEFLNIGITLIVAPVINQNDLISLDALLEISSLVDFRDNIPIVDRSTAQSNVSVQNNGTIILGGLRQRNRIAFTSGVPLFSRIPLLGALFRSKRNEKAEREIILILRPQIVQHTESRIPTISEVQDEAVEKLFDKKIRE